MDGMTKKFRHFQYRDRVKLEALIQVKKGASEIAEILGFSQSAVYRELARGRYERLSTELIPYVSYSADIAQKDADYKSSNKGAPLKIGNDFEFTYFIENQITQGKYSPAAALAEIELQDKHFKTRVCFKTLYNYIDQGLFLHLSNADLPRKKLQTREYHHVYRIKKTSMPQHRGTNVRNRKS